MLPLRINYYRCQEQEYDEPVTPEETYTPDTPGPLESVLSTIFACVVTGGAFACAMVMILEIWRKACQSY